MSNLLLGFFQFLALWGCGLLLAPRLSYLPERLRAVCGFSIAEISLSYALLLLGSLHLYTTPVLTCVLAFVFVAGSTGWLVHGRGVWKAFLRCTSRQPIAMSAVLLMLLIYGLGACVPEREVDSLWYHLAVPQQYLLHGGIVAIPFNLPSHYPMNMHLHYVLSLFMGNDTTAKAFNVAHWVPLLMTTYALAATYAGRRWGLTACLLLLGCIHFQLPVMANVQRPLYFYILLSTGLLWHGLRAQDSRVLLLSAVTCGMAIGTKYNALFFALGAQVVLILTTVGVYRSRTISQCLRHAAIHTGIALTMLSPWLIKSWLQTGNPVYPLAGGLFPTQGAFRSALETYEQAHGLSILKAQSLSDLIGMVQENLNWMLYNADLFVFITLVTFVVLPLSAWKRTHLVYRSTVILLAMFPLFWGLATARLYSATYGIFIVAIACLLSIVSQKQPRLSWLPHVVVLCVLLSFAQQKASFVSSPNIRCYGVPVLSEESRQTWLEERSIVTPGFFAMREWIHENLPPGEIIYVYDAGYPFYLDRKVVLSDALFGEQLDVWLLRDESPYERLRDMNVTYLFDGGKRRHLRSAELQTAWEEFTESHLQKRHQYDEMIVYELVQPK